MTPHYLQSICPEVSPHIRQAIAQSLDRTGIDMHTCPEQLQFYRWLIHTMNIQNVLEIGTFTGITSLYIAESLPASGHITTIDRSPDFTKLAQQLWQTHDLQDKVTLLNDDASSTLTRLCNDNAQYDMVIVDANKMMQHAYYEHALKLTKSRGIILIDNTYFHGLAEQYAHNSLPEPTSSHQRHLHKYASHIHQFNAFVREDPRVIISCLPLGDGLTCATKI